MRFYKGEIGLVIVPIGGDIGSGVIEKGANETIDSRRMELRTRI